MKGFRAKDGHDRDGEPGRNGERDFHNGTRCNDTHASTTDPDARLYKESKGDESRLGFLGHLLMENRNGLVVDTKLTHAGGTAEREAALDMLGDLHPGGTITVGADKAYDTRDFVADARAWRDAACRPEHQTAWRLGHRQPHHSSRRLLSQPGHPQTDRGGKWLDQGHGSNQAPRPGSGLLAASIQRGCLQPDPHAQADADGISAFTAAFKGGKAALKAHEKG